MHTFLTVGSRPALLASKDTQTIDMVTTDACVVAFFSTILPKESVKANWNQMHLYKIQIPQIIRRQLCTFHLHRSSGLTIYMHHFINFIGSMYKKYNCSLFRINLYQTIPIKIFLFEGLGYFFFGLCFCSFFDIIWIIILITAFILSLKCVFLLHLKVFLDLPKW